MIRVSLTVFFVMNNKILFTVVLAVWNEIEQLLVITGYALTCKKLMIRGRLTVFFVMSNKILFTIVLNCVE